MSIPRWMLLWRGQPYRWLMKLAHRFDWHYAPPSYPDGDKMLWCQWCGFRAVVERRTSDPRTIHAGTPNATVRRKP